MTPMYLVNSVEESNGSSNILPARKISGSLDILWHVPPEKRKIHDENYYGSVVKLDMRRYDFSIFFCKLLRVNANEDELRVFAGTSVLLFEQGKHINDYAINFLETVQRNHTIRELIDLSRKNLDISEPPPKENNFSYDTYITDDERNNQPEKGIGAIALNFISRPVLVIAKVIGGFIAFLLS